MTALIILSLLGVATMMTEALGLRKVLLPLTLAGVSAALVFLIRDWGTDFTYFNGAVRFDQFALAFSAILTVIYLLWMILAAGLFGSETGRADLVTLSLFALSGAVCMVSFGDLTTFFIGLEILSISLYVLAASSKRDLRSNESGMKYLLMGAFATGFLLFGIALVYGATGTFNLERIAQAVLGQPDQPLFLKAGVLLILTGLLFKVSAAPFHFWAPDVYEGAPTAITAFMATLVKTAAFGAFYRLFSTCFAPLSDTWGPVVAIASAVTMVAGNVLAVYQTGMKRMLAYSSVAHAGYLLMAVLALNEVSAGSLMIYTFVYSLGSLGAFAAYSAVSQQGDERTQALTGLSSKQPLAAAALAVVVLSLAGIPPLAGFFAKYSVFYGAALSGANWLVFVAIVASLIGVSYYFRMIYAAYKTAPENESSAVISGSAYALLLVSAALTLVLGLYPALFDRLLAL